MIRNWNQDHPKLVLLASSALSVPKTWHPLLINRRMGFCLAHPQLHPAVRPSVVATASTSFVTTASCPCFTGSWMDSASDPPWCRLSAYLGCRMGSGLPCSSESDTGSITASAEPCLGSTDLGCCRTGQAWSTDHQWQLAWLVQEAG